ncbi:MAG: hypothetical protein ACRERS_07395, partial [Methylococcales bacterium]
MIKTEDQDTGTPSVRCQLMNDRSTTVGTPYRKNHRAKAPVRMPDHAINICGQGIGEFLSDPPT